MKAACIDIGSNTTRLLAAELGEDAQLTVLASDRAFTRIGAETGALGEIPAAKITEVASVVASQARLAQAQGTPPPVVVGTAVVRQAPNRSELADAVRIQSGLSLQVLSGDAEAQLSFFGARAGLGSDTPCPLAVVDVGGGSTEIAVGSLQGPVSWCCSLGLGSGSLANTHISCDPPAPAEVDAVSEHVARILREVDVPPVRTALAVGGTATSLLRMSGNCLTADSLERSAHELTRGHSAELATRMGLPPERTRLLPAGVAVLRGLCRHLGQPLGVASGGLREGLLREVMAGRFRPNEATN